MERKRKLRLPFQGLAKEQRQRLLAFSLSLLVVILTIALVLIAISQRWNNDFVHLWQGGYTLAQRFDPYSQLLTVGEMVANSSSFINLPWVGIFFVPYGRLAFENATIVWTLTNGFFLISSLVLAHKILVPRLPVWGIRLIQLGMLFLAVRAFQAAQITVLLTFLGLAAVWAVLAARTGLAGVWLGLTIWKPTIAFGLAATIVFGAPANIRRRLALLAMTTAAVVVLVTTVIWPNWPRSYATVDFRQALGIIVDDVYVYYWPVATLGDFARIVLGLSDSSFLTIVSLVLPVVFAGLIMVYVLRKFQRGNIELLELCALGALLPALASPYIRYYDYIFLSIWLVGLIGGVNYRRLGRRMKILVATLIVGTYLLLLGTHPEPWVYIMPVNFSGISLLVFHFASRQQPAAGSMVQSGI